MNYNDIHRWGVPVSSRLTWRLLLVSLQGGARGKAVHVQIRTRNSFLQHFMVTNVLNHKRLSHFCPFVMTPFAVSSGSCIIYGQAVFYVSSANWHSRLNQQLEWKPNPNPSTKVVRAGQKYRF